MMTRQLFHDRLLRLIKAANRDRICPACVLQELVGAAEGIVTVAGLDADILTAHGISNVVLVPGGTYDPPESYDGATRH
jgi:hypothetical protein